MTAHDAPTPVGLNLLWLVPGVVGGTESYAVGLLHALAELAPTDLALTLFVNERFGAAHPDVADAFATVVAPTTGDDKAQRVAIEQTWLGSQVRRRGLDVVHHLGGTAPVRQSTPTVLTIHDLQPLAFPEHFSIVKRAFIRAVVPPSVRRAALVTVLSGSTRNDLVRRLGTDVAKIRVVPPGFDPPAADDLDDERRREVRRCYGLGEAPFFLYPAITYPHKNHELLVRAFAAVAARRDDVRLVLSGGEGQREAAVANTVAAHGLTRRVHRVGRVSGTDLDVLYRDAVAVTFPSRYEGFGIPVLEAMSRGCPVIAADLTALPEVVGSAGVLVDAGDPDAWAQAMTEMLENPAGREALVAAGLRRATTFDWHRSAEDQADVYRELRGRVAAGHRGRGR